MLTLIMFKPFRYYIPDHRSVNKVAWSQNRSCNVVSLHTYHSDFPLKYANEQVPRLIISESRRKQIGWQFPWMLNFSGILPFTVPIDPLMLESWSIKSVAKWGGFPDRIFPKKCRNYHLHLRWPLKSQCAELDKAKFLEKEPHKCHRQQTQISH